ncbi:MAG: enterochelin esterase, partial [Pseudoxanthomonas sp.]
MLHRFMPATALALGLTAGAPPLQAQEAITPHRVLQVTLDSASRQPASGRLLVFATDAKAARAAVKDGKVTEISTSPFSPKAVSIAAQEVTHLAPGRGVQVDLDQIAFPDAFSMLADGDYLFQAVLDVDHSYNYGGRGAGDLISDVTEVALRRGKALPPLSLTQAVADTANPWGLSSRTPQAVRDALPEAKAHTFDASMTSPALSAFWGRDTQLRARVLVPPGYDTRAGTRYPTVYVTHGFTGDYNQFAGSIVSTWDAMARQQMPAMIWVFLDQATPT